MADNVVEVVVKSRDQAKPDLDALKARLDELGQEVATARAEVNDTDAAAKLDKLRAQLLDLDHRTANPKISMSSAVKAEAAMHAIESEMAKLNDSSGQDGDQAGRSWGSRFASAATLGLRDVSGNLGGSGELGTAAKKSGGDSGGFWASGFTKTVIGGLAGTLITGVGSVMATLPALGAIGGVGLVAGLGAMIASKIPGVANQFKAFGTQVMGTLENAVKPLVPFITSALKQVSGFVTSIGPELSGLFKAVGPMLQPLISGFEGLIKGVLPGLSAIIKSAMPAIQGFASVLAGLGKNLGSFFQAIAPAVAASAQAMKALFSIIGGLLPVIGQIAGEFAKALAPALTQLASVFTELGPTIRIVASVFAEFAKALLVNLSGGLQAIVSLVAAVAPAFTKLAQALGQVFNLMNNRGVFNDLEDAIEGLVGPLGKLITALINGLVPILPPLIGLASSLAGTLQGVLIAAVRALVPLLVPLVGILAELLQKAILPLLPFVEKLANMLAGFLVKAVQALLPAVAKLAMALLEILVALTPLLPPIMQLATTLLSLALKVITPLVPLITTLAGILAGLASVIATVIGWIAKIVAVALTWITNFGKVGHAIATLFDWIKGHWPLLLLILTGPIGAAIAIILALFPNLLKGVENVARDVASWFGKLPHMILEALGDLGSLLFGSGEKIIQGLINGIGSMIGDVEHAVSSVVDDIKSFLPFSPAKKGPLSGSGAPDVSGRQIAAMLAQGMTSGAGPVQAAAAGLARAAGIGPGSSGAGAGGAGTAGNPGQVTIQLQAGGSSGLDQLFMQWLKNNVRASGGDPRIFNRKVQFAGP